MSPSTLNQRPVDIGVMVIAMGMLRLGEPHSIEHIGNIANAVVCRWNASRPRKADIHCPGDPDARAARHPGGADQAWPRHAARAGGAVRLQPIK